jgi:hypothetical protein
MQRYEECQVYALWRTLLQGQGNFRLNDYGFHCTTLIVFLKPFKWNITFCQQHYPCIHSLPICWHLSRSASFNFPGWTSILGSDVHHQISWHHWLACQSLHGCGSRFPNLLLEEKGNKRQTELDWGGEGEGTTLDIVSPTTGPFGSGDCLVRTVLLAKTHPHVHFTSFASIVIWCI